MPARKMRVEVYDEDGNQYTITFNGRVTRDKAIRLFDLVELLGGMPEASSKQVWHPSDMSKYEKIQVIVEKKFPVVWFSSKDIQSTYEKEFTESIRLSTISTYLSRMVQRGILLKRGPRNRRHYKILTEITRLSKITI